MVETPGLVVQGAAFGPGVLRVPQLGAEAGARGEDPRHADGAQGLEPVRILHHGGLQAGGRAAPAPAVAGHGGGDGLGTGFESRGLLAPVRHQVRGHLGGLRGFRVVLGTVDQVVEQGPGHADFGIRALLAGQAQGQPRHPQDVPQIVGRVPPKGFRREVLAEPRQQRLEPWEGKGLIHRSRLAGRGKGFLPPQATGLK